MKGFGINFDYARNIPGRVYAYFLLFVLLVYFGLLIFQIAIVSTWIPQDFTIAYLYLNVSDPNPSMMYFNNFMHNPYTISHLTSNIQVFLLLVVLVFIIGIIVLPATGCQLPKFFFFTVTLLFVTGLPFALSGISIWTGRIFEKTYVSGFSGLNFALLGLFLFLFLLWLFSSVLKEKPDSHLTPYILLSSVFFIVALVVFVILLDLANPVVGVYSHLGGFLLGLIIPAVVGIILLSESLIQKIVISILLAGGLIGCAIFWMIV